MEKKLEEYKLGHQRMQKKKKEETKKRTYASPIFKQLYEYSLSIFLFEYP